MANTWTAIATAVTHSTTAKVYLQLFNAGTRVLRVYRVWMINANITAVTGVNCPMQLGRITTAASGGSPSTITPVPHDSTNSALSSVTCNSGNTTATLTGVYRRFTYSTDEFAVGAFKVDNLQGVPRFALYWDGGYGDTNVLPIVLPQNHGLVMYSAGIASAAGNADVIFEFTDSAT